MADPRRHRAGLHNAARFPDGFSTTCVSAPPLSIGISGEAKGPRCLPQAGQGRDEGRSLKQPQASPRTERPTPNRANVSHEYLYGERPA